MPFAVQNHRCRRRIDETGLGWPRTLDQAASTLDPGVEHAGAGPHSLPRQSDSRQVHVTVEELSFRPRTINCPVPCFLFFTLAPGVTPQRIRLLRVVHVPPADGAADDRRDTEGGLETVAVSPYLNPGDSCEFRVPQPGNYIYTSEVYSFMTGIATIRPSAEGCGAGLPSAAPQPAAEGDDGLTATCGTAPPPAIEACDTDPSPLVLNSSPTKALGSPTKAAHPKVDDAPPDDRPACDADTTPLLPSGVPVPPAAAPAPERHQSSDGGSPRSRRLSEDAVCELLLSSPSLGGPGPDSDSEEGEEGGLSSSGDAADKGAAGELASLAAAAEAAGQAAAAAPAAADKLPEDVVRATPLDFAMGLEGILDQGAASAGWCVVQQVPRRASNASAAPPAAGPAEGLEAAQPLGFDPCAEGYIALPSGDEAGDERGAARSDESSSESGGDDGEASPFEPPAPRLFELLPPAVAPAAAASVGSQTDGFQGAAHRWEAAPPSSAASPERGAAAAPPDSEDEGAGAFVDANSDDFDAAGSSAGYVTAHSASAPLAAAPPPAPPPQPSEGADLPPRRARRSSDDGLPFAGVALGGPLPIASSDDEAPVLRDRRLRAAAASSPTSGLGLSGFETAAAPATTVRLQTWEPGTSARLAHASAPATMVAPRSGTSGTAPARAGSGKARTAAQRKAAAAAAAPPKGSPASAAARAAVAEERRQRELTMARLMEDHYCHSDRDSMRPAASRDNYCSKCRMHYVSRINYWRCRETHQQAGAATGGGRGARLEGPGTKETPAQVHRRSFISFLEQLPPRRLAAIADISNTLEGVIVLQAAAKLCTSPPYTSRPGAPLWRGFSPASFEISPSPRRAASSSCGEDCGGSAAAAEWEPPEGWRLLPDLLLLAMPDDGSCGRGPFWRGADYCGNGTGDDDQASAAFTEVDNALEGLSDNLEAFALADQARRAADRDLGAALAHEAATLERAGLPPRRQGCGCDRDRGRWLVGGNGGGHSSSGCSLDSGSDGSGDEEENAVALLPLHLRAAVRAAKDRVEAAGARVAVTREQAAHAMRKVDDADRAADLKMRQVMAQAAAAAPRHALGPSTLSPCLLDPLGSLAPNAPPSARAVHTRLPGNPCLAPDLTRCYWRLWRGKWARLRSRFRPPAECVLGPVGGWSGVTEGGGIDVDYIIQLLISASEKTALAPNVGVCTFQALKKAPKRRGDKLRVADLANEKCSLNFDDLINQDNIAASLAFLIENNLALAYLHHRDSQASAVYSSLMDSPPGAADQAPAAVANPARRGAAAKAGASAAGAGRQAKGGASTAAAQQAADDGSSSSSSSSDGERSGRGAESSSDGDDATATPSSRGAASSCGAFGALMDSPRRIAVPQLAAAIRPPANSPARGSQALRIAAAAAGAKQARTSQQQAANAAAAAADAGKQVLVPPGASVSRGVLLLAEAAKKLHLQLLAAQQEDARQTKQKQSQPPKLQLPKPQPPKPQPPKPQPINQQQQQKTLPDKPQPKVVAKAQQPQQQVPSRLPGTPPASSSPAGRYSGSPAAGQSGASSPLTRAAALPPPQQQPVAWVRPMQSQPSRMAPPAPPPPGSTAAWPALPSRAPAAPAVAAPVQPVAQPSAPVQCLPQHLKQQPKQEALLPKQQQQQQQQQPVQKQRPGHPAKDPRGAGNTQPAASAPPVPRANAPSAGTGPVPAAPVVDQAAAAAARSEPAPAEQKPGAPPADTVQAASETPAAVPQDLPNVTAPAAAEAAAAATALAGLQQRAQRVDFEVAYIVSAGLPVHAGLLWLHKAAHTALAHTVGLLDAPSRRAAAEAASAALDHNYLWVQHEQHVLLAQRQQQQQAEQQQHLLQQHSAASTESGAAVAGHGGAAAGPAPSSCPQTPSPGHQLRQPLLPQGPHPAFAVPEPGRQHFSECVPQQQQQHGASTSVRAAGSGPGFLQQLAAALHRQPAMAQVPQAAGRHLQQQRGRRPAPCFDAQQAAADQDARWAALAAAGAIPAAVVAPQQPAAAEQQLSVQPQLPQQQQQPAAGPSAVAKQQSARSPRHRHRKAAATGPSPPAPPPQPPTTATSGPVEQPAPAAAPPVSSMATGWPTLDASLAGGMDFGWGAQTTVAPPLPAPVAKPSAWGQPKKQPQQQASSAPAGSSKMVAAPAQLALQQQPKVPPPPQPAQVAPPPVAAPPPSAAAAAAAAPPPPAAPRRYIEVPISSLSAEARANLRGRGSLGSSRGRSSSDGGSAVGGGPEDCPAGGAGSTAGSVPQPLLAQQPPPPQQQQQRSGQGREGGAEAARAPQQGRWGRRW